MHSEAPWRCTYPLSRQIQEKLSETPSYCREYWKLLWNARLDFSANCGGAGLTSDQGNTQTCQATVVQDNIGDVVDLSVGPVGDRNIKGGLCEPRGKVWWDVHLQGD